MVNPAVTFLNFWKRSMTKSRTLLVLVALLASSAVAQVRSTISFDKDWLVQTRDVTGRRRPIEAAEIL